MWPNKFPYYLLSIFIDLTIEFFSFEESGIQKYICSYPQESFWEQDHHWERYLYEGNWRATEISFSVMLTFRTFPILSMMFLLLYSVLDFTPEISRQSLRKYWAISFHFISLVTLDCSRSWLYLADKICTNLLVVQAFPSIRLAWRG